MLLVLAAAMVAATSVAECKTTESRALRLQAAELKKEADARAPFAGCADNLLNERCRVRPRTT